MMRLFRRLADVSLIALLVAATFVKAAEPQPDTVTGTLSLPADSSKIVPRDAISGQFSRAAFTNATPAVRVAMCGVEADSGNTNLDAGLIDFNTPDPARGARQSPDDQQSVGANVRDYHSSVFLGVTVGYHF